LKVVAFCFPLVLMCLAWNNGFCQERHLIPFELQDQFDEVYTNSDYEQQIVLVIGSDKEGKKYNPIWSEAITSAIHRHGSADQVSMLGIANLRGVPFFLKGMIKGKLPKDPENKLLLDWSGHFAKAYKFEDNVSNIVMFDKDGNLALKTYGTELEHHKLNAIVDKIFSLMDVGAVGQGAK